MSLPGTNKELRFKWEQRALNKTDTLSSVLFQGLPEHLNNYIHTYHHLVLKKHILPRLNNNASVLDIGCGYGRISQLILQARPDIDITGIDFSFNYCNLYKRNTGAKVACSELSRIPILNGTMDVILAITVLMYAPYADRHKIMLSLANLLKPDGVALFIDPSREFIDFIRKIRPGTKKKTTGGQGFTKSEYYNLANQSGMKVLQYGGMPLFSVLLPLLYPLRFDNRCTRAIFRNVSKADINHGKWTEYTLHRWILLKRQSNEQ